MWNVELKPEVKAGLKDPERFKKGINIAFSGILIVMLGVAFMFVLYFLQPNDVLRPGWIMLIGFGIVAWGEYTKFKAR